MDCHSVIHRRNSAIIVIDMINEYLEPSGKLFCKEGLLIIPTLRNLLNYSRDINIKIIYVNTLLTSPNLPLAKKWGLHATEISTEAKVISELKPMSTDYIVYKFTYDGFYNTELENLLRSLEISNIFITGIHTHVCVLFTAVGGFHRGFNVYVLEDCITTSNKFNHESRLSFFNSHVGMLIKTDELYNMITIDSNI